MFEKDHMDEFDLQVRSILENGQEEVPAGVWEGVSAGLDKAARTKVVSLWFRRAGLGVAAAAAVVAGFIFIDASGPTDIVPAVSEDMIAVVSEADIKKDAPEDNITPSDLAAKTAKLSGMVAEVMAAPSSQPQAEPQVETVAETTPEQEAVRETIQETVVHKETTSGKTVTKEDQNHVTDTWIEEKEPKKRNIKTSLILSGIAGTNSPSSASKSNPFRSPALDRAPSTTIQQTGTETYYGIPVSVGLGAKINLTKRWAVSAGINYTYLTSKFDGNYINVSDDVIVSVLPARIRNMQHYIGIPVSVYYDIIEHNFINFYAHAGGAIEKCILNKYEVQTDPIIYHTQAAEGVQFSANVGIGVEFMLGKHVGIYLDPSLRYYFRNNQPKSIRTAQPLMLGFEAGFRFNL